ncbi:hypothetical protein AB0L25_12240 [Spirillospora sp. NPDC052242]
MPGDVRPARDAVSLRIGSLRTRFLATTGAVFFVLGVYVIFYAAVGDGMEGSRDVSILFGAASVLLGLFPLPLWWRVIRPRRLVFDAAGLHRVDPQGIPWTVEWRELDGALRAFAPGVYRPKGRPVPAGRARPVKVAASVVFLAVFWVVAMVYTALETGDLGGAAIAVVWVLAVAAWLVRVWAGGPTAITFMVNACTALGGILLAASVLFGLMFFSDDNGDVRDTLVMVGRMVLGGLALLVPGRLLARADVREWSADRHRVG